MKVYIILIIIHILNDINFVSGFCESRKENSITLVNTYNISIIGNEFKTEIGNSLSSLSYTALGLYGNFNNNNHNYNYYVLNNIFILMGLSSALHHFFYTNNSWAYYADILCLELLISYSLLNNIYYVIKKNTHIYSLIILSNLLIMLICNNINLELRTTIIKVNMGFIIINQLFININIIHKKNKYYGIILLKHNISNALLFSLCIIFFYNDDYCDSNSLKYFNPHAFWHIFSGLALNNSINTTIMYYCLMNNKKYKIRKLINSNNINNSNKSKSLYIINNIWKYLLLNVELDNNKYIKKNSSTSFNIEDIKLLKMENGIHRRIKSYG